MPLLDHFRPPLSVHRHWHAFHNAWATYIASDLNRQLPAGYFAEPNVQFGVEIDVAAFEGNGADGPRVGGAPESSWMAPAPAQTVPIAVLNEVAEVLVFSREGGPTLAGAVELVSPGNKDRPGEREAFVSKCASYIQQGVGLVIVDVVTTRQARLHDELVARLDASGTAALDAELYAVAYRAVDRAGQPNLAMWPAALAVGQPLPTLPLWLRGDMCLAVQLEETYERTCREQRVAANGA